MELSAQDYQIAYWIARTPAKEQDLFESSFVQVDTKPVSVCEFSLNVQASIDARIVITGDFQSEDHRCNKLPSLPLSVLGYSAHAEHVSIIKPHSGPLIYEVRFAVLASTFTNPVMDLARLAAYRRSTLKLPDMAGNKK